MYTFINTFWLEGLSRIQFSFAIVSVSVVSSYKWKLKKNVTPTHFSLFMIILFTNFQCLFYVTLYWVMLVVVEIGCVMHSMTLQKANRKFIVSFENHKKICI